MDIRLMTLKDYDRISALWQNTQGMGLSPQDDTREGIARYLARNPATCFIAQEGELLAGAILCGHDGRRAYLYHMAVAESFRRRGIGSVLLNHAMAALAAEGITKAAMLVFATNENGNAFWQKQGFEARPDVVYRNRNIEPPLAAGDATLH